jgi:cobalt-zinc-cadmium resistance protein CzcA
VVVGAMICTWFLTRYMMPVLYSLFSATEARSRAQSSNGPNYSARFMQYFPEEEGVESRVSHDIDLIKFDDPDRADRIPGGDRPPLSRASTAV